MARGRGRTSSGSSSDLQARRSRQPTAAEQVDTLFGDVELAVDRLVHERVDQMLAEAAGDAANGWGRRYAGGVADDTTQPASDLVLAAEHALAGDQAERERALELLHRAMDHQQAYLKRLEAALAEPRRRPSHEMWKAAGIKSTDSAEQLTLIDRARALVGKIGDGLADPDRLAVAQSGRARTREGHGRDALRRTLVGGPLTAALEADDPALARALLVAYWSKIGDDSRAEEAAGLDDEQLLLAGRLRRAEVAIGKISEGEWVSEAMRVNQERLDRLTERRRAGDEVEREGYSRFARRRWQDLKDIPAAENAEQVLALARAMTRTPSRFRRNERVYLQERAPAPVVVLNIPASPAGIRDLEANLGSSVHWEGLRIFDSAASHRGGKRSLQLAATLATQIGEQQVQIVAHTHLGTTLLKRGDHQGEWLRARAAELELDAQVKSASRVKDTTGERELTGEPVLTEPSRGLPRTSRARTLRELVGDDICAHPRGRWVTSEIADTAHLTCPDCHRTRIAAVPLHRLPAEHPLAPADSDPEYLGRERYHAELAGDRRPFASVGELRARDGIAEVRPAAYRTTDRAPARDSFSLASAFAGGRRVQRR